MSHFSETLSGLMELEGHTQAQMSERSGIDRPTISRFCNGHMVPTREMLGRLCAAISTDVERRVELLLAHVQDEAEAGANAAGISPRDFLISRRPIDGSSPVVVPFPLQATFSVLIDEASKSNRRELMDVLEGLVQMI